LCYCVIFFTILEDEPIERKHRRKFNENKEIFEEDDEIKNRENSDQDKHEFLVDLQNNIPKKKHRSHHHIKHQKKQFVDTEDDTEFSFKQKKYENEHSKFEGEDEMHDDLTMLTKNRESPEPVVFGNEESIASTLSNQVDHLNDVSGESGSGASIDEIQAPRKSSKKSKHHRKKYHPQAIKTQKSNQNKQTEKMKIKTLEHQLKRNGAIINTTNYHDSSIISSKETFGNSSGSGSGSGDIEFDQDIETIKRTESKSNSTYSIITTKSALDKTFKNKNTTKTKAHDIKTRNKILKPEKEIPFKNRYGHKEDIFKEFKSKHDHKEEILSEASRMKKLKAEIQQQENKVNSEDEDEISGDREGSGNIMKISTTEKQNTKHKKQKNKATHKPTATPNPTTTTTTTTKKVVAVLKFQRHSLHPTKSIISKKQNNTNNIIVWTTPSTTSTRRRKLHPNHKAKTTVTTATSPTTTSTTTTTATPTITIPPRTTSIPTRKAVPTVAIDGVTMTFPQQLHHHVADQTKPKQNHLKYDEEESIKDLSKISSSKLNHNKTQPDNTQKHIPSLNINIGDADGNDGDQEETTTNRKVSKTNTLKHQTKSKNDKVIEHEKISHQASFDGKQMKYANKSIQIGKEKTQTHQLNNKTTFATPMNQKRPHPVKQNQQPTTTIKTTTTTTTTTRSTRTS